MRHDFLPPSRGSISDIEGIKKEYLKTYRAFRNGEPTKAGWCYDSLVGLLRDSISLLKADGYTPEIIGFCWMQGESDACLSEHVANYKIDFDCFVNDFQKEFSQYLTDCIYADAGISEIWPCYEDMNSFKKEYAKTHSNFRYIDTIQNGLTTKFEPMEEPDIYHYDCESVIKLGKLFAQQVMG